MRDDDQKSMAVSQRTPVSTGESPNTDIVEEHRPESPLPLLPQPPPSEKIPEITHGSGNKPKFRRRLTKPIKVIGQSLFNSVDDVVFKPVNPKAPNNAVYIDYFLKSTWRDFKKLGEAPPEVEAHDWIDANRLPFLTIVLEVQGSTFEKIRSNCDLLFMCLALAFAGVCWALYNTLYSVGLLVFGQGFLFGQLLTAVYWGVFLLFTIMTYFYYNYHTWIIASDRFGLPRQFLRELIGGERAALFPLYDYYQRYYR